MVWLLMLLGLAAIYGWLVGRDRALTILMSLYAALAFTAAVPLAAALGSWTHWDGSLTALVCFLAVFFLTYFLLWGSEAFHCLPGGRPGYIEAIGTGALHVGLLVSIVLILLPEAAVKVAPVGLLVLFGNAWTKAFWLLAPLIFLYFSRDGYSSYYEEE